MNLFGMGAGEMAVIMILALIIFGPGRLPEIMGTIGKTVRDFKRMTNDMTSEFSNEIGEVRSTMTEMQTAVKDMQRETSAIVASIPAAADISSVTHPGAPAGTASPADNGFAQPSTTVQSNGATATVATKDDPFADLVELDDPLEPVTGTETGD